MQIEIILDVFLYAKNVIEKNNLVDLYRQVAECTVQLQKESGNAEIKDKLASCCEQIVAIQQSIEPAHFNSMQVASWNNINKNDLLGIKAAEHVNHVLCHQYENYAVLVNNAESLYTDIQHLHEYICRVLADLSKVAEINSISKNTDNNLFVIYFNEDTNIRTIEDLEKCSRIWNSILQSFVKLTRGDITDLQIYDIDKGTFMIYANPETISSLIKSAISILDFYRRESAVKKLQVTINELGFIRHNEIIDIIDLEMREYIKDSTSALALQLLTHYGWNPETDGEKLLNYIYTALRQIHNFIQKGGRFNTRHNNELQKIIADIDTIDRELKSLETTNKSE